MRSEISQPANISSGAAGELGSWGAGGARNEPCRAATRYISFQSDWWLCQGSSSANGSSWLGGGWQSCLELSCVGAGSQCVGSPCSNSAEGAGVSGVAQRLACHWRLASNGTGTQRWRRCSGQGPRQVCFELPVWQIGSINTCPAYSHFLPRMKTNIYL